MLRLAFDFIITWRETRTRPNAYSMFGGNSSAPSVLPNTVFPLARSTPEPALKQVDINPCPRVQLRNWRLVGEKILIPFSVLIKIFPSFVGRIT